MATATTTTTTTLAAKKTTTTSSSSPRQSKKRRVCFEEEEEEDDHDGPRQVKRRVLELPTPKSSLLTREEKQCCWMQHSDHRETLQDVMALIRDCHHESSSTSTTEATTVEGVAVAADPNKVPFSQYAEALAITFTLCDHPPIHTISTPPHGDDDDDDDTATTPKWNIRQSRSVAQLALWASYHTPSRGVESKILPGLMQERQVRRTRAIRAVLETQQELRRQLQQQQQRSDSDGLSLSSWEEQAALQLCAVSESLTHSAKEFASALAVVDGTQALLEYSAMEQQQQLSSSSEGYNSSNVATTTTTRSRSHGHPPPSLSTTSVVA